MVQVLFFIFTLLVGFYNLHTFYKIWKLKPVPVDEAYTVLVFLIYPNLLVCHSSQEFLVNRGADNGSSTCIE